MNPYPLITEIETRNDLTPLLENNPGLLILKFGADWCGPCKLIEEDITKYFNNMPNNVQCGIIDIDICFDLYAFLKSKKIIATIPAILCYKKYNLSTIAPDHIHMSSDKNELRNFINICLLESNNLKTHSGL
tara:strand:- start:6021 stop:6416 length:396 start_codon:yes stop_codon:yes gene_type:complete